MDSRDDFFSDTPNDVWYLSGILNGRFLLEDNDTVIYDTVRNLRTKVNGTNKVYNPNIKKQDYLKYEIIYYVPTKKRRKVYFHKFVWMYYNKQLVPEDCAIVHKDDDIYNCTIANLRIDYPKIEDEDFYNDEISIEQWFLSQILKDRFELSNMDSRILDKKREKYTIPGDNMDSEYNGHNLKKKVEYVITSGVPYPKRRKMRYHRLVWMYYHRKLIPEGYDIHHKDENGLNNYHGNLELLSHTVHSSTHIDTNWDKKIELIKHINQLKYKICYHDKKICSSCERMLPFDKFGQYNDPGVILKLTSHCKECIAFRVSNQLDKIYKFPIGVLSDKTIINIRFKFQVTGRVFRSVLHRYQDTGLTKEQLHDILLGKTYNHLELLHGIKVIPYKFKDGIGRLEYNHIMNSMQYGDFTVNEISIMYGRSVEEINQLLLTGMYKERIDMENDINSRTTIFHAHYN